MLIRRKAFKKKKLNKKSRSPHGHTQRHAPKLAEEEEKLKSYSATH